MKHCGNCDNRTWPIANKVEGPFTEVCLKCRYVAPEDPSNWVPQQKSTAERLRDMSREAFMRLCAECQQTAEEGE